MRAPAPPWTDLTTAQTTNTATAANTTTISHSLPENTLSKLPLTDCEHTVLRSEVTLTGSQSIRSREYTDSGKDR